MVPNVSPLSKKDARAEKKKKKLPLKGASTDDGWAESSVLSDSLNSSVVKGQEESAMDAGWEESSTSPDSSEESAVTAPAPQWEIGQRVMVDGKGNGTLLYAGELSNLTGVWYGVHLDVQNGKNDGSWNSQNYFYCPAKHGAFVRSEKLKNVDMSDQEIVLKALLKGDMISRKELECLSSQELQLFFNRKELSFEMNQKKDVYVNMVVRHLEEVERERQESRAFSATVAKQNAFHARQCDEFASHAQKSVQAEMEQVVPNQVAESTQTVREETPFKLCTPAAARTLGFVDVKVGSKVFCVQPAVKERVDKVGAMLAKLSAESEELIKDFQYLIGDVETNNMIFACFGQAALKISESFNGTKAVLASAGLTSASQAAQPCELDPEAAVLAKLAVLAQVVTVPLKPTEAVTPASISVSVPAASPKSKKSRNSKVRSVTVQAPKPEAVVKLAHGVPFDSGKISNSDISITTSVFGHRKVVTKATSREMKGTVTSVRGCEAHEANFGLGEITDGAGVKFVFLRETAYGWLKKGEQVEFCVQHHTVLKCKQAINVVVVSDTPSALSSAKKQAQSIKPVLAVPEGRQSSSSVGSASANSRQGSARLYKKGTVTVHAVEPKPNVQDKAVSGGGDAGNARLKSLERVVAGLRKLIEERLPPPVSPLPAPCN